MVNRTKQTNKKKSLKQKGKHQDTANGNIKIEFGKSI